MTMLATILVPDGIVMAADKRMNPGRITVEKLFLLKIDKLNIGVSFSTNGGPCGSTLKNLLVDFQNGIMHRKQSIKNVFEELKRHCQKDPYPDLLENSEIQLCGYENENQYIYTKSYCKDLCKNGSIGTKSGYGMEPSGSRYPLTAECLSKYIEENILKIDYSKLRINDAVELMKFFIIYAIEYWDIMPGNTKGCCGNGIDILVLAKDQEPYKKSSVDNTNLLTLTPYYRDMLKNTINNLNKT